MSIIAADINSTFMQNELEYCKNIESDSVNNDFNDSPDEPSWGRLRCNSCPCSSVGLTIASNHRTQTVPDI